MRLDLDQPLKPFQAFVVAGGQGDGWSYFSSVVTLLPGAPTWTPLASLPTPVAIAQASLVRGRMWLTGSSLGSQVIITLSISNNLLSSRSLSTTQPRGTSG